jgi:hypothetical protein
MTYDMYSTLKWKQPNPQQYLSFHGNFIKGEMDNGMSTVVPMDVVDVGC